MRSPHLCTFEVFVGCSVPYPATTQKENTKSAPQQFSCPTIHTKAMPTRGAARPGHDAALERHCDQTKTNNHNEIVDNESLSDMTEATVKLVRPRFDKGSSTTR